MRSQELIWGAWPSGFLVIAMLLGGASAGGIWARCLLTLLAIAILAIGACRNLLRPPEGSGFKDWGRFLPAAMAGWLVIELVPLPPAIWTHLAGRDSIVQAFALSGAALSWLPLSLTPDATLGSLLALLPPAAMLAMIVRARPGDRLLTMEALAGFALLSTLLGFAQVMAGEESMLYPYAITNRGSAVGLFANRNHLATLLLMAMPALGALAAVQRRMLPCGLVALVLVCGVVLVRADAGLLLLAPTIAVSLWIARIRLPSLRRRWGLFLLAGLMVAGFGLAVNVRSVTMDRSEQHRPVIWARSWAAVRQFAPIGAGGGSFMQVYPAFEDPAATAPDYVNHAHSDALEIVLEHGLPGILLAAGVIFWWLLRLRALAKVPEADPLALAGAAMLGIVLLHSLVDYPLRTSAIAVVAALAAGLLATPVRSDAQR